MTRDNFSAKTRFDLAASVNFQCANPACSKITYFPSYDLQSSVNVGNAAHITAAASGGPRYDDTLTSEQRKAADNGVHLCAVDARHVDADQNAFPVSKLKEWQREKMRELQLSGGQRLRYGFAPVADVNREANAFISLCERLRLCLDINNVIVDMQQINSMSHILLECRWKFQDGATTFDDWQAGRKYHAQDTFAVRIQLSALETLWQLFSSIKNANGNWHYNNEFTAYLPNGYFMNGGYLAFHGDMAIAQETIRLAGAKLNYFRQLVLNLKQYISEKNARIGM